MPDEFRRERTISDRGKVIVESGNTRDGDQGSSVCLSTSTTRGLRHGSQRTARDPSFYTGPRGRRALGADAPVGRMSSWLALTLGLSRVTGVSAGPCVRLRTGRSQISYFAMLREVEGTAILSHSTQESRILLIFGNDCIVIIRQYARDLAQPLRPGIDWPHCP